MDENLRKLLLSLNELNSWLSTKQVVIKITVIGRFAFYLSGMKELATSDIDTVTALQDDIFNKVLEIGIANGMKPEWLNDNSEGIPLPEGFETRLQERKDFSNIEIKYASRFDLICLKAAAYVNRGGDDPKDFQDLLLLTPNSIEIKSAIDFVRKHYNPPATRFFPDFEEKLNDLQSIAKN